jgi:hypothetical protein
MGLEKHKSQRIDICTGRTLAGTSDRSTKKKGATLEKLLPSVRDGGKRRCSLPWQEMKAYHKGSEPAILMT